MSPFRGRDPGSFWLAFLALCAMLLLLPQFVMEWKHCKEINGVYVRTAFGFECIERNGK